jgi:HIV Tat-specific factor 1
MAETATPFPDNPEDFDDDARISFNRAIGRYSLEAENGTEWEWIANRWTQTARHP